ncbi:MAG: DMT family transporter [Cohaesibacter sp.]|jgi:transporter family-2 protein|nr:DMT family transporter [Cohaesibacter sp.]
MNQMAAIGIATALAVGLSIGFQGIFAARLSMSDSAVNSGMLIILVGGILAAMLFAVLIPTGHLSISAFTPERTIALLFCAVAGIIIVSGSAFAFAKISPAAAVALIIFGQMSLALAADYFGWTGQEPQPIDLRRIGGLAMLVAAIWMLIPNSDQ